MLLFLHPNEIRRNKKSDQLVAFFILYGFISISFLLPLHGMLQQHRLR